jgi:hypothetical protein
MTWSTRFAWWYFSFVGIGLFVLFFLLNYNVWFGPNLMSDQPAVR